MKKLLSILLLITVIFTSSCIKSSKQEGSLSVLVFITGVLAGSPTYEMMAEGALEFAQSHENVTVKIYEAGTNQAHWEEQLGEMVSSGEYDIVIGSNPSLPQICVNTAKLFPDIKFIITDAHYEGHPQIRTYFYNQYEQSLLLGYLAGLITISDMRYANSQKKIGFIAAQEYPLLTMHMVPGFLEGAKLADSEIELDFRVIGTGAMAWVDANKAAELASAMMNAGVDVFTSIAGGASQGLIKTAVEKGAYIVWYNINAYSAAPGIIVGCGIMEQKKLVTEILNDIMEGKIQYGVSQTLGVRDGYLGFITEDAGYKNNIPDGIREKFENFISEYYKD